MKQYYVPKIAAKLTELDPAGKATYDANAAAYSAELDALDAELKAKIATIPAANRKLVTFHDAFPYFARHFGFELVGVILANVGQEPTAAELAALVDKVKAAGVKAVFSEAQFSPKLAQTPRRRGRHHEGRHDALQRRPRARTGRHVSRPDALERRPDRGGPPVKVEPTAVAAPGRSPSTPGRPRPSPSRLDDVTARRTGDESPWTTFR